MQIGYKAKVYNGPFHTSPCVIKRGKEYSFIQLALLILDFAKAGKGGTLLREG